MNLIKFFIPLILVIFISCNNRDTSSMGSSNEVDLSQFKYSGNKKTKVNDGIIFHEQDKFMKVNDGENSIENVNIQCVPFDDGIDPSILFMPDPNSFHPEWKGAGFVGSSYTFVAKKRIINTKGVFFYGDLISPRGGLMGGGPYYVICSEWDYSGESVGLKD